MNSLYSRQLKCINLSTDMFTVSDIQQNFKDLGISCLNSRDVGQLEIVNMLNNIISAFTLPGGEK